jgi:putative copper export protein
MITPTFEWFLLVFHLLGVSVWLGGQITLLSIMRTIKDNSEGLLPLVARGFARTSWTALGVVVATGVALVLQISPTEQGTAYSVTLALKLALVFVAVAAVIIHSTSKQRLLIALGGAIGLVASLGSLALGVLLSA